MEEENSFLKIIKLKTTQKLTDRNFVTEIYLPKFEKEKELGTMLILIEILSPWFPAANVGKLIFNEAIKKYYDLKSEYENNQVRLEETLKSVNRKLSEVANKGEVEWLGNLNAICAVIFNNHLLISQTGTADAFLFRQKSFSHITEGLKKEETPHPLKTFTNLTAGELNPGDKILITNQEIFSDLPFQEIREVITKNKIISATNKIKKTLTKKRNSKVNYILFKIIKSEKTINPQIQEIILDEKKDNWLTKTAKLVQPVVDVPRETLTEKELAEQVKEKKKMTFGRKFFTNIGKITIHAGQRFSGNFKKKTRREITKEKLAQHKIDTKLYGEPSIEENKAPSKKSFISVPKAIFMGLGRFIASIFQPERRRFSYFLGIIILIIALVLGVSALRKSQARKEAESNARQLLVEAQAKMQAGDEQLALNQEPKAKDLYLESISLAQKASEHPKVEEEANGVIAEVQQKIDQIDNIVRIDNPKKIVDFGTQNNKRPDKFCLNENNFYTINPASGQLTQFSLNSSEISNLGTADVIKEPIFTICSSTNIYTYTNANHLFRFDLEGNAAPLACGTDQTWAKASQGQEFLGNLYLLDSTAGQIWKFRPEGENFSQAIEYLNTLQTDIKNAKSFTIDGYIYVITRTNKLIKMLSGTLQTDFKPHDIPTPLTKIKDGVDIYTDADLNFIYILDKGNHRVIEIDKEGLYTRQYVLPESLNDLKQVFVSQKTKKLYVMNASAVYEIEM
jgi:hypothetical protein